VSVPFLKGRRGCVLLLPFMLTLFVTGNLYAQHGHPIVGTWSGFLNRAEGQPLRALFTFEFSVDQIISGSMIINARRYLIDTATLNPDDWSVDIIASGQNRAGETLTWHLQGKFEKLDSPTERTIAGMWEEGDNRGDFRIVIN
jgi:hypothetical protein